METEPFEVQHRGEESRYVILDLAQSASDPLEAGEEKYLDYDVSGDAAEAHRIFFHTEVAEAYGGQGLASKLVRAAVEHAIGEGRSVVPVCPYVAAWAKKHPELSEHFAAVTPEHLQALSAQNG